MSHILFKYLDRLHPEYFVLCRPKSWDFRPQELSDTKLSQPTVDAIIAVNPKNPAAIPFPASTGAGQPHPLSEEAMRQNLPDDPLKALRKCTETENLSTIHDMVIIKFKKAGFWIKPGKKRSTEMNIAHAEACNGGMFQLASMVELMNIAKLPEDDKAPPSYFVLGMPICGEEWTVECTMRERPERKKACITRIVAVEDDLTDAARNVDLFHNPSTWQLGKQPQLVPQCFH